MVVLPQPLEAIEQRKRLEEEIMSGVDCSNPDFEDCKTLGETFKQFENLVSAEDFGKRSWISAKPIQMGGLRS